MPYTTLDSSQQDNSWETTIIKIRASYDLPLTSIFSATPCIDCDLELYQVETTEVNYTAGSKTFPGH